MGGMADICLLKHPLHRHFAVHQSGCVLIFCDAVGGDQGDENVFAGFGNGFECFGFVAKLSGIFGVNRIFGGGKFDLAEVDGVTCSGVRKVEGVIMVLAE